MADKLDGNAIIANTIPANRIQTGSITSTQLQTSLYNTVTSATHPKIRSISYPGNDTAANTGGGDTITLTGTGFGNTGNVQIYINGNVVSSITVTNANSISFTAPALAAATYPVYLINTSDGSTAILIPGIQYSGMPSWSTSTPLSNQDASSTWSIQLVATSDSAVSYSLQAGSSLPAGITLAANGLISGTMTSPPADETTYNFTVVANDLENQDASRAFSVTVTVAVLDPYFTYTTLLLHGDGTNNANNHAFVDSSNNAFAITRNGNASQGTFSPFGDNWSYYFDGDADEINAGYNSNLTFGSGNFTIECWVYTQATGIIASIWDDYSSAPQSWIIGSGSRGSTTGADLRFTIDVAGADTLVLQSGVNQPMNQWFHFAVTRNGSNWYMFFNGIQVATASSSATISAGDGTRGLTIGAGGAGTNQSHRWGMNGYISNFRIIKGNALYTSNFTPPTQPLSAVSNTTLLTCQSNAFIDKGPNRYSITRVNNTTVSKFDPFKPYKAIPASYGVYFDGTGDYLTAPANNAFAFSGDFTIEFWVRTSVFDQNTYFRRVICFGQDAADNLQLLFYNNSSATSNLGVYSNSQLITGTIAVADGNWHHIALCRSGSSMKLFVDGTQSGSTATTSQNFSAGSTNGMFIGRYALDAGYLLGHMSNLRVLKGTALYTSAFTPPTSPLTAIANTQLLTCQSTTIIDNSTNAFTITRNGDAIPTDLNPFTTTFVSEKYNTANGGGAIYCDGSGDYLSMAANSAFSFGTGNFTVEGWVYYGSVASAGFRILATAGVSGDFGVELDNSNQLSFGFAGTSYTCTGGTAKPNAWNHLAVVRSGSTIKGYINGVEVGSTTNAGNITNSQAINFPQTANYSATSGYIASVRYVKGTAVYLSPFVPPTAPVTNIANTSFLCNFTNAGILDSVGKNVLETVGDARVNTSVKKYGTGSMYFDGTGDYLKAVATVDNIAYGTGDFTVECWAYFVNAANLQKIFDNYNGNNNPNAALCISNPNANKIQWYSGQTKIVESTSSLSNNTWYHIAVSRTGSTTRLFINGNQEASASDSSSYAIGNGNISIGAEISTGLYSVNGHIDDLRITKGVARYRYNFTPPTKAFNDGDGNLANNTTDVLVGDQVNLPVFPYTTLLLHGDGTNNANNHAFVDSSNNAFAITRNGNATQGTFSPFSPTGWSGYFDGASYISVPDSADFTMGSGDFTIQCWVYSLSDSASDQYIVGQVTSGGTASATSFQLYKKASTYVAEAYVYIGGAKVATSGAKIPVGQWTHLAMVRDGGTMRLYVNGVQDGTNTTLSSSAIVDSSGSVAVGRTGDYNGLYFNGYISNVSIVKGTCLFPNGTTFTPSTTPLSTNQSGQSVLLCRENRFIDSNTTPKTVTISGASIQAFSPFAPSVEYAANTHGGSAYFDGTGDYLSVGDQTAFEFGSGDYTIELWWYPTSSTDQNIVGKWDAGGSEWILQWRSAGYYRWASGGSVISDANITLVLNAWNHVAVTKSGTSLRIYSNGVQIGTTATEGTISATGAALTIGAAQLNSSPLPVFGYISNLRILKGTAQSTGSTYTVATSPLTAVANTQLLCNFTNAGILDSTGKNVLETVGDAKVNTATKKYGTGSMYFDGTGDSLDIRTSKLVSAWSDDFTIEGWFYTNSLAAQNMFWANVGTNSSGYTSAYLNTNGQLGIGKAGVNEITSATGIWTNAQWNHLAWVRSGSNLTVYLNGLSVATTTSAATYLDTSTVTGLAIGKNFQTSPAYLNGYVDDFRITRGIARYVNNFTPPTAAFLNK